MPFALGVIVGAVIAVKLGYRFAPRTLLVGGGLVTAAGFAWFGLMSADGSFPADVLGPSIVTSIGFGLCLGPVVSLATAGVASHETGTASGLLASSRQIGASLGLAVLGTAAHRRTGEVVTAEALNDGYALGMTLGAALLVGAVLIAFIVLRRADVPAGSYSDGDLEAGEEGEEDEGGGPVAGELGQVAGDGGAGGGQQVADGLGHAGQLGGLVVGAAASTADPCTP